MSEAQATRIVAIRHGETDWNALARIQGHTDISLNHTGHWQASRTAQALAHETIDVVYSSDLARARLTAQALADGQRAPLVVDEALRERHFGRFEGLTFDQIERRWPDQAQRWRARDPDFVPGDEGESLRVFYARCMAAAEALASRHRGGTIALVAHGGVLDCLYRAATRMALHEPRSWVLGNASINRLLHTDQGFGLVGWNDVQHLDRTPGDESSA